MADASVKGRRHISVNFAKKRPKLEGGEGLIETPASGVKVESARHLWPPYLPAGKITVIAGDPGMAKSTIVIDLIARVTRGTKSPTGERMPAGTCLVASAEDAAEDTIVPRLLAAGADLKRVGIIRQVRVDGYDRFLSLPSDLDYLREAIIRSGARILVLDPINAYLEKGCDSYKDQDVRRVLAPLDDIANETSCAIIIVAHLNKKEDSATLYRVGGSIGFIAAARSVLGVSPFRGDLRVLYSLKNNLAARPPALAYRVRGIKRRKRFPDEWVGENVIRSSAVLWKGEVPFDPQHPDLRTRPQQSRATDFLRQMLADGPLPAKEIEDAAAVARPKAISKSTLYRAACAMQIEMKPSGFGGAWVWELPRCATS